MFNNLRKYTLFTMAMFFVANIVNGQNLVAELDIKPFLENNSYNQIIPHYNLEAKETTFLLREWSDLTLLVVNEDYKIEKHISGIASKLKPSIFAGISVQNNIYTYYSVNPSKSKLEYFVFNTQSEKVTSDIDYINLARDEKVLNYFSSNNSFYIITVVKNTSDIFLIRYENGKEVEKKEFNFENSNFPHFLADNLFNCVYYDDAPMRSSLIYTPLVNSNSADYIEVQNNILYLVSNTNTVVSINLLNYESHVNNFSIEFEQQGKDLKSSIFKNLVKQPKTKSCIVDGYFFRCNIFNKNIGIEMYDIQKDELLFDYELISDDVRVSFYKQDELIEDDFGVNSIFYALKYGKLNFSVNKNRDNFRIRIGKSSSPKFWARFDNAIKKRDKLSGKKEFVGIFYDHKENQLNFNQITPLSFEKNEEKRITELSVDKTGKLLESDSLELSVNRFFTLSKGTSNPYLNLCFIKEAKINFIVLDESNNILKWYD